MTNIMKKAAPERGLFVPGSGLFARPVSLQRDKFVISDGAQSIKLRGGPYQFDKLELLIRTEEKIVAFITETDEARDWALADGCLGDLDDIIFKLTSRSTEKIFGNLSPPLLMGVVNITPDSFYDGGKYLDVESAISKAHGLIAAGADIIDIGGESSKPGAVPVAAKEEIERVIPVIKEVVGFGVPISIDTKKSSVMEAAIIAGASIVNDITALAGDP